jgi:hypothetical protein
MIPSDLLTSKEERSVSYFSMQLAQNKILPPTSEQVFFLETFQGSKFDTCPVSVFDTFQARPLLTKPDYCNQNPLFSNSQSQSHSIAIELITNPILPKPEYALSLF